MNNVVVALDILASLIKVATSAMDAASRAQELINRARHEGRDISDEELASLQAERKRLEADWKALAPKE